MVDQQIKQQSLLDKKTLFLVLLASLFINLVVWFLSKSSIDVHFGLEPFLQIDSFEYISLGKHIFEDGTFPNFSRTPVYPFFVGFFNSLLNLSLSQFVLIQILLSLCNLFLLWRLTAYFLPPKYQLFVILVFALDLVTIQVTNYVLSETLFSFFLLLGINVLVYMKFNGSKWWLAVLAGLSFGLFALCRPIGQYLPFLLLVWFLFVSGIKNKKTMLLLVAFILFSFMVVPEAWKLRNKSLTGHAFISTTTSINMYNYRAAWNVARRDGRSFNDVKHEFQQNRNEFINKNKHLSEYEVAEYFTREGLKIILDTPFETIQQGFRGVFYLYGGIYNSSIHRVFGDGFLARVIQVYSAIYLVLVYLGVLLSLVLFKRIPKNQKTLFFLCVIVIGYFTFFSSAVESYARLRTPFFPYIVLISTIGWLRLINKDYIKS